MKRSTVINVATAAFIVSGIVSVGSAQTISRGQPIFPLVKDEVEDPAKYVMYGVMYEQDGGWDISETSGVSD